MKLYPKYKDSGIEWIGEVPEHWSALRLKWVCNFLYGESLSAQEREDGIIPVYGSNGIVGYHNRSITEKPCIIVGRKGSFGKVAFSEKKCYPIDTTYYIDCTSTKNYMRWLWYLLPLLKMDEFSRDSAVPGLNREDAYRNIVTLPSSYEQQQIAAYLDRKTTQIDNLISKKQKLIELFKEKRSAIINQAVTKGLNPDAPMKDSGIEWIGKVPEHWEVKRLKYFFRLITEKNCSLQTKKVALENIESWTGRFIDSEVDYQGEGISFLKGDVLFGKLRPYLAKVLNAKFSGASVGDIFVMRPKLGISSRFAFYRFLSKPFIDIVNGSTFGAKMPRVSWDFIANLHIAMPNNKEQRTISGYLDSKTTKIDQTISRIEKQTDLLQEFRTALISEAVTGKIDVRDGGSNG